MALKNLQRRLAIFSALCICLTGCADRSADLVEETIPETIAVSVQAAAPPEREKISRATLLAVGDNLIHDSLYKQAQARTPDASYDFKPLYQRVAKQIAAADIAMINQETPIVKDRAPSTYPLFNTPPEMTENLRDIGFDVLSISNNHMIDQGADGLMATAAQIRATKGLTVTGVYDTPEQRDKPVIVEKNGIKFAFLGFTQYTNGLVFPKDRQYMAVYTDDAVEMRRQIALARESADCVVVSVHWGTENTGTITEYQQAVAQQLAEDGADIIVGTHPHVLQPADILETKQGKKVPVVYSLGNFVSAQSRSSNMIGAMMEVTVEKNQTTGVLTVSRPLLTPTVTHYGAGMRDISIYPLSEYSDQLALSHGVRGLDGKPFSRAWIEADIAKVIAPTFIAPEVREAITAAGAPETPKLVQQETKKPTASSGEHSSAATKQPAASQEEGLLPRRSSAVA